MLFLKKARGPERRKTKTSLTLQDSAAAPQVCIGCTLFANILHLGVQTFHRVWIGPLYQESGLYALSCQTPVISSLVRPSSCTCTPWSLLGLTCDWFWIMLSWFQISSQSCQMKASPDRRIVSCLLIYRRTSMRRCHSLQYLGQSKVCQLNVFEATQSCVNKSLSMLLILSHG